ncbi:hypothetical protein HDU97_005589 [Phlyctochytrium planicorne]|nr:hypothetical protein HDU97_005589 [Phlyctochytrium planicorne]
MLSLPKKAIAGAITLVLATSKCIHALPGGSLMSNGNPSSEQPSTCPPPGFDAVKAFDIEAYLNTWYVQLATETDYTTKRQFFYNQLSETEIDVFNYSNNDTVNGPVQATLPSIRGTIQDPSRPSKLTIHPRFVPVAAGGPYWVVATYPETASLPSGSSRRYEWAIISGGPPEEKQDSGYCLADKKGGMYGINQGLFFFTRERFPSEDILFEMKRQARGLGLDLTRLKPVEHEGCLYKF